MCHGERVARAYNGGLGAELKLFHCTTTGHIVSAIVRGDCLACFITAICALNRAEKRMIATVERQRLESEQRRHGEVKSAWTSTATHQRQRQQVRVLLRQRRRQTSAPNARRTDWIVPQTEKTVTQPVDSLN